jgi:hypothetical protein
MMNRFKNFIRMLFFGYTPSLVEEVKSEVAKECGIDKNKLPKVKFRPLPFIIYDKIIGKIAGVYDSIKHRIYIDPLDYLRASLHGKIKLLAEEFSHAADYIKGIPRKVYRSFVDYLRNYNKDESEVRAKAIAEKVARKIVSKYREIPEGSFAPCSY